MGQQCDQSVDQALAYFRSFYVKDGQLVSFSFLVSRAVRKDDPMYAKHWDILVAQRSRRSGKGSGGRSGEENSIPRSQLPEQNGAWEETENPKPHQIGAPAGLPVASY